MRNSTQLDPVVQIPDCVHAAVVHAFQPENVDVWEQPEGPGINNLWKG